MKLRVIYGSRLVRKGYSAWVLFPFMFFRSTKEAVSDKLFRHEMEHVYQVLEMGWWVFYAKYLWFLWRKGYDRHPYEILAWAAQDDPLTPFEKKMKDDT